MSLIKQLSCYISNSTIYFSKLTKWKSSIAATIINIIVIKSISLQYKLNLFILVIFYDIFHPKIYLLNWFINCY